MHRSLLGYSFLTIALHIPVFLLLLVNVKYTFVDIVHPLTSDS